MSDTAECRRSVCSDSARPVEDCLDAYAARFCSVECELKHDHIRADAADRRRGEHQ